MIEDHGQMFLDDHEADQEQRVEEWATGPCPVCGMQGTLHVKTEWQEEEIREDGTKGWVLHVHAWCDDCQVEWNGTGDDPQEWEQE